MRFTSALLATVALSASTAIAAPKEHNALWSSECQALVGTCLQATFRRTHKIATEQEKRACVCGAIKAHKKVSSCSRYYVIKKGEEVGWSDAGNDG